MSALLLIKKERSVPKMLRIDVETKVNEYENS